MAETPKPHDPRAQKISPDEVRSELEKILSEVPNDLATESELLARAHEVLHSALQ
ncbi:Hypothetical protein CpMEX30_1020 [Corynebacterium pseudotuberculosis]|nr:Hypothetical protein CpPAT10_0958 [Corynebacterium pseudotuberculosis PAT10]AEP70208.1 Hypothetical protein Cp4202_0952 [Corynebacterium pseudotuberculosis 42/02-A]AER69018.1 Hypothetical protein Cp106_0947 [Corynebacterium pseudotuberculosis 1/06-A]AEX39444.1 Hypothetical protein Cp3995_0980 [Corynebacterium pseudotuberculosis 3/99-5]AFF22114.1 Hypothetical protein CpP54B96_0975 [Corynebacterium pseudotuberculosis P54B96]AFH51903.1 Hypothetical protein Cp267_1003 [Corynebacterium pseudotub